MMDFFPLNLLPVSPTPIVVLFTVLGGNVTFCTA